MFIHRRSRGERPLMPRTGNLTEIVIVLVTTVMTFPQKRFVRNFTSRFCGNVHLREGGGERPVMPQTGRRPGLP
jgi:hypothetical protein